MTWMKHNITACREMPGRSIIAHFGLYGYGLYWCLMERVAQNNGIISVEELTHEFCSKYFNRGKIRHLIVDYDAFTIDANEMVSLRGTAARANLINNLDKNRKEKTSSQRTESENALLAQAANEKEKTFYERMLREYPNICSMRSPLTYAEMNRLLSRYPSELVVSVLNDMENYPKIDKRYNSAYRTAMGWIDVRKRRSQL